MNDVHMLQSKHPIFQSLIPLKRSWVPFCRRFEFSFHPHKSCKPVLGLQWANLLPLTAQSRPLDTLRWSLITSKGSVAVFLISVASFLFFCSPWCSNPNIPIVSQCTTALMWYDHIHDMQMLFYVSSCFLFFACFIMGISLCSWFRWQAHVCCSKTSISRRLLWPLGYNYLNLPTDFLFKLPNYGYWII